MSIFNKFALVTFKSKNFSFNMDINTSDPNTCEWNTTVTKEEKEGYISKEILEHELAHLIRNYLWQYEDEVTNGR